MRKWFHLFALPAFVSTNPAIAAQPTTQNIIAELITRLHAALPQKKLTRDPEDPFKVTLENPYGDSDAQIYFDRIVNFCLSANKTDCKAAQDRFIAAITTPPPKHSRAALRIVVRDQQYADAVREFGPDKSGKPSAFMRQIGDDLYALLALDSNDQIAIANSSALAELEIDQAAAWTLAAVQTQTRLAPLPTAAQLRKNARGYETPEYGGSFLADVDTWAAIAAEAGPDLFATVVSDQFVMVGLMSDGPALDKFAQTVAEDCRMQERCISPHIYRFRSGRWVIAK